MKNLEEEIKRVGREREYTFSQRHQFNSCAVHITVFESAEEHRSGSWYVYFNNTNPALPVNEIRMDKVEEMNQEAAEAADNIHTLICKYINYIPFEPALEPVDGTVAETQYSFDDYDYVISDSFVVHDTKSKNPSKQ